MSQENGTTWANPATAGLTALAIVCTCFFAILTGIVPHTAAPMLGCWMIGGFVVQFVVALIELRSGAMLGGNVFLLFSAFFMLTGGMEFIIKASSTFVAAGITAEIDGWAWLILLVTLILWTPAYLRTSPRIMGLLVIALDVGVLFVTLRDLGIVNAAVAAPIAGWALLITSIFAIYFAAAIQLNDAFDKTVLPLGKPML